jgi:hypothetical protein
MKFGGEFRYLNKAMVMVVVPWRSGDFQPVCVCVSAIEGRDENG